MASSSRQICRLLTQFPRRVPAKRKRISCPFRQHEVPTRTFTTVYKRQAEQDQEISPKSDHPSRGGQTQESTPLSYIDVDTSNLLTPSKPLTIADLSPEDRATYDALSKPEQANYLALQNHAVAVLAQPEIDAELEALAEQAGRELDVEDQWDLPDEPKMRFSDIGFWADDEDDEIGQVEDGDDDVREEDITSIAENALELHREIREYTRIAAWDMPLLASKSFYRFIQARSPRPV